MMTDGLMMHRYCPEFSHFQAASFNCSADCHTNGHFFVVKVQVYVDKSSAKYGTHTNKHMLLSKDIKFLQRWEVCSI